MSSPEPTQLQTVTHAACVSAAEPFSAGAKGSAHRLWHLGSPLQWALCDALVGFACMLAAFHLSPSSANIGSVASHARPLFAARSFAVIAFLCSYVFGLNHHQNLRSRSRILVLVLMLAATAVSLTLLLSSVIFYKQIGRYILAIAFLLFFFTEALLRLLWNAKMAGAVHQIVIWSDSGFSAQLQSLLARSAFPSRVVAMFQPADANVPRLKTALDQNEVHEVVVHMANPAMNGLLLGALDRGITVSTMDSFSERHFFRTPSTFITADWFFQIDLKRHHPFYTSTKRLLDVGVASATAVVTFPLVVIAAIFIKLESRGSIFYSQTRVGLNQKPFTIHKLRTMRVDSEVSGPQWATLNDSRVTRVGWILRKTRIDELPQLWNIICGEMALVGPRPERPEFVEKLAAEIPFYSQRHLIKPGLTGWAQICFPYGASKEDAIEKLSYDLYYLKNATLLLDLQIMMQTIGAVAKGSR